MSFTDALTQGNFGTNLNLIGAFYQINRFVIFCNNNNNIYLIYQKEKRDNSNT